MTIENYYSVLHNLCLAVDSTYKVEKIRSLSKVDEEQAKVISEKIAEIENHLSKIKNKISKIK